MRKIILFTLVLILIGSFTMNCSKDPVSTSETDTNPDALILDCEMVVIKPLIAAQHESIGTVKLRYEDGFLKVIYWIPDESEWSLVQTHTYVGTNKPEKTSPGRFPYKNENPDPKYDAFYVQVLPGTCIWFAAHAEVVTNDGRQETAWAEDDYKFEQGWGWYCYICFPAN